MNAKSDHEDTALAAFCDELTARGCRVRVTAHPDRYPGHPLSVDALIDIDGEEWAIDHCLLSRPPQLPPAMNAAEAALQTKLDQIAHQHGRVIVASYLPQTGTKGQQWGAAYYDKLIELAEQAAATEGLTSGDDGFATVQAIPSQTPGAVLVPFTDTTASPFTITQLDAGLREPFLRKLDGQLRRAKEAGYPTALLLDQLPRPGGNSHTVWNAGPTTVAAVAARILRDHQQQNPNVLDQVWLRPSIQPNRLIAPSIHLLIAQQRCAEKVGNESVG